MSRAHEEKLRNLVNSGLSPHAAGVILAHANVGEDGGDLEVGTDVVLAGGSGDVGRTAGATLTLGGGAADGVNEVQSITGGGTISGGTWDLTISAASVVLVDIPWDVTAAELQALVASSDVEITGGPVASTPFLVEYVGALARTNVAVLVVDDTNLTGVAPTLTAATDTPGSGGTNGGIFLTGLPTSDPAVAGQLWSNSGVLTVSAG